MVDTKTLTKNKCILATLMLLIKNCAAGSILMIMFMHVDCGDSKWCVELPEYEDVRDDGASWRCEPNFGWTKSNSYFMPNRDVWRVTRSEGNPTGSALLVNSLIKCVKKKEVRKEGVDLQPQCPFLVMNFLLCITFWIKIFYRQAE
jgi:hypothetical protein